MATDSARRRRPDARIIVEPNPMTEPTMRRPTIKDVAAKAKVSLKTVSRVINNEPSVMQGTRARVLHAIAELDYEPDQSARNLRSGTPFVIGLIYDNPNPYHIIGVQNGVLAACRETGFGLQIHPCDSTSPLLADELTELVQRSRLAGLVLTAPMSERMDLVSALAARGVCCACGTASLDWARRCGLHCLHSPGPPSPSTTISIRGSIPIGAASHRQPCTIRMSMQRWPVCE